MFRKMMNNTRFRTPTHKRTVLIILPALILALVLWGLPAWAGDPQGAAVPGPADETPLHELVTAPKIDTYIDEYDGASDADRSQDSKLRLRRAEAGEAKILLQFDLAGIPADAIIQSVELQLYVVSARPELSALNAPDVALYRVSKPWCAGADWTRSCDQATWCQAGAQGVEGACAADPDRGTEHVNAQISVNEGLYRLKVHAASPDTLAQWVQDWVSGEVANQGLLLELAGSVKDVQHIDFAGSGYFGFPEASAPLLKVVYVLDWRGDIQSTVWMDKNANGVREAEQGEGPLIGQEITLYESGGEAVASKTSSDCGESIFADVPVGDYYLCFGKPADYIFAPQDVGANDLLDSDADPATGCTSVFTLHSGEMVSLSAGMYAKGMVLYFPIVGNQVKYWP